jgi:prolyl oligopeptidase
MKLTLIAVGISALLMGCSTANQSNQQSAPSGGTSITGNQLQKMNLSYPNTRKDDVTDSYFGTQVADPYRWLEDDMSSETKQWVKAENAVTQAYLAQVPSRDKLKERLKVLLDYEKACKIKLCYTAN